MPLDGPMGSHFHDWIDYDGVAFSIEVLEWGCTFSEFWGNGYFGSTCYTISLTGVSSFLDDLVKRVHKVMYEQEVTIWDRDKSN